MVSVDTSHPNVRRALEDGLNMAEDMLCEKASFAIEVSSLDPLVQSTVLVISLRRPIHRGSTMARAWVQPLSRAGMGECRDWTMFLAKQGRGLSKRDYDFVSRRAHSFGWFEY